MTTRDPVGTLYLDHETGIAYRLSSYGRNWQSKPFDPTAAKPHYSTLLPSGAGSSTAALPTSAVEVWRPTA